MWVIGNNVSQMTKDWLEDCCSVDHWPVLVLLLLQKEELMDAWYTSGGTTTRIRVIGVIFSEFLIKGKDI